MHLKRQKIPKKWPIIRKGTAYVVKPRFNLKNGIPLLIVLRNILKIVQNRRELKKAIHLKNILVNSKVVKDERYSVSLFDIITITPKNKNYRLELTKNGKFCLIEIKESESKTKISKVVNKKILKGKKVQLNLNDGQNLLSDFNCEINDSVIVNLKDKKIEKCLSLKKEANVIVFNGKHAGINGGIKNINEKDKIAEINIEGKIANVLIKHLMVIE